MADGHIAGEPATADSSSQETASSRRNKSHTSCCVPTCGKPGYLTEDGHQVSFHKLPANDKTHLRDWIVRIRQDIGPCFQVTPHTCICLRHFEAHDFRMTYKGKKFLKESAYPTRFSWNNWNRPVKARSNRGTTEALQYKDTPFSVETPSMDTNKQGTSAESTQPVSSGESMDPLRQRISELEASLAAEHAKRNLLEKERNHVRVLLSQQMKEANKQNQFGIMFKDKDSDICFYTGFPSYNALCACFKLSNPENCLKEGRKETKLSYRDQFFLTLVRLRLGLFEKDLADRFNISQSSVNRIFKRWINFM